MISDKINSQQILDALDLNKINHTEKKKRGRPKKTLQLSSQLPKVKLSLNENEHDSEDDEIILHLPISKADILSLGIDNLTINDMINNNLENNSENFNDEFSEKEVITNDTHVKQFGSLIKKLKEENDELKKYLTEITPMYFTEVKLYPIDLKLFEIRNIEKKIIEKNSIDNLVITEQQIIPKKTNLNCWWCTYKFDCLPSYLPEKYSDNKFYVIGCFCSFNCSGAYNLSLNDNKVWERYSLLKQMYYMINKEKINSIIDIEINIAGPKELLEKYGGPMKIEEYRKNSKILGREYHKLLPPFVPINISFEETTNSKTHYKNFNINNLINSNNKNDNIIIKRNKPITNFASKHIDTYIE